MEDEHNHVSQAPRGHDHDDDDESCSARDGVIVFKARLSKFLPISTDSSTSLDLVLFRLEWSIHLSSMFPEIERIMKKKTRLKKCMCW